MHIGLYFGSFNPVHVGHLIIADHMAQYGGMDKVWMVVSPQNPFKALKSLAHEHDRMEMVRLATFDNTRLEASDIEMRLPKPSYTINTLRHLAEKRPDDTFSLIMGEDNLSHLAKWRDAEELVRTWKIFYYPRQADAGSSHTLDAKLADIGTFTKVEAPVLNLSATLIRQRIQEGKGITYLVPDSVEKLIESKGLYR